MEERVTLPTMIGYDDRRRSYTQRREKFTNTIPEREPTSLIPDLPYN